MSIRNTFVHLCCAASVLAIPLACDQQDSGEPQTEFRTRGYSGEELFLGIVLGQGDAAAGLPTVWDQTDSSTRRDALADLLEDDLVRLLDEADVEAQERGADHVVRALGNAREQARGGARPVSGELADLQPLLDMIEREEPGFFERFAEEMQSGDHRRIQDELALTREVIEGLELESDMPDLGVSAIIVALDVAIAYDKVLVFEKFWYKTGMIEDSVIYEEVVIDEIATNFGP